MNYHLSAPILQECTIEIARLQERLISALPSTVFEQLVEERNSHNGVCSQLLWSKDPRIKLAVFLHPSISRFNVDAKERMGHSKCLGSVEVRVCTDWVQCKHAP